LVLIGIKRQEMNKRCVFLLIATILIVGCNQNTPLNPEYISDGFDFPVGKSNSDASQYYIARNFGERYHLGEDWNGLGGGNTDLGDPIYAISNGYVKSAKNVGGGWGKTIRIIHKLPNGNQVESLFAHCNEILVKKGSRVKKGQKIGTIGTASGRYRAHLHFEIRDDINMGIGKGYSKNTKGYLNPTKFIKANR